MLTLLCLMALLVMQAVGGFHAYLCDCGGAMRWTNEDHCFGPHSTACHDHELGVLQRQEGDSGDRHDHEQVVQELKLRSVENFQLPAVIPLLLTWSPDSFVSPFVIGRSVVYRSMVEPEVSPPSAVTVARAVVFII
jgi:hypothetical protein